MYIYLCVCVCTYYMRACLLPTQVRAAFLKAIGCREAAKRQKSVMSHSRRMSKASVRPSESMQSFVKRSFTRARKDNYVVTDITSLQLDEVRTLAAIMG